MARLVTPFLAVVAACSAATQTFAGGNLLQDPGFERHHFDKKAECYLPDDRAAWRCIGDGPLSIRFDASTWSAPDAMKAERPLGFTPGLVER